MRRAFVSHSSADDRYVAEMESFLRAAGFDEVFNDVSSIRPDGKFWPKIEDGISNCDSFVVVITAASNDSEWVKREVEFARSLSKNIIPVWVEDCPVPSIFADRDVIDFRPRTRQARPIDISRIGKYAPEELIGREPETKLLSDAWSVVLGVPPSGGALIPNRLKPELQTRPRVLTFVALGGEGKTSLVAKWAAELAAQDWPGCDAVFAWSFYSQGTREQAAASSDTFLAAALTFFGDAEMAGSSASAFDKGRRLVQLVGERRALLILDGVEPLQYAPTSPTPGELKDQGLAALLKGLAANSRGLCIVTTRYSISDLKTFWQTTAPEAKLLRLSREAGVKLLQSFGVKGSLRRDIRFKHDDDNAEMVNEFEHLVEDVDGHALTLQILGQFLARAFHGDIRQRDRVKFEKADERIQGGHAFRAMDAYVKWLEGSESRLQAAGCAEPVKAGTPNTSESARELAILSLLGLFDRPAMADCVNALRQAPAIPGLTEPLVGLADNDWEFSLTALRDAKLLTVNRAENSGELLALDAHPLLREYIARRVRERQPKAWRTAHRRLYEHLCASTHEGDAPTLEALQPLYQAVAHGCHAGLQQEAYDSVLRARIHLGEKKHSWRVLGAFGTDLGGMACFFEKTWDEVSCRLDETSRIHVLRSVAFRLIALGRQFEALEPAEKGAQIARQLGFWDEASASFVNLTHLRVMLGNLDKAVEAARFAVECVDIHSGGEPRIRVVNRMNRRGLYADVLSQAGRFDEARRHFIDADELARQHLELDLLGGLSGFRYCSLLLMEAQRLAWQAWMTMEETATKDQAAISLLSKAIPPARQTCHEVEARTSRSTNWFSRRGWLLDIAVSDLTLATTWIYRAAFALWCEKRVMVSDSSKCEVTPPGSFLRTASSYLDEAVKGLRQSNQLHFLPLGLLARAWLRLLTGTRTGHESAQSDLDEALEIAARGPMKLFLADIHLHRARLFFREKEYPWNKNPDGSPRGPKDDLAAAEKLINSCGYHRRDEELADAKRAILGENAK